ncbi:MAG: phosphate signaling complex protein PhoU [Cytophagales bacterium]|nr:phosphate signaling complex protein PhoU [Armatimonadota bacterium]
MPPTRQRFEEDLDTLRSRLLEMGAATEEIVRDAILALTHQDMALAATIIPRDDAVDRMEVEIESLCLRLMTRQPPLAADLRLIGTALKAVTDIERIGDHAVDIARVAQRMSREMLYKPLVDIPRMGEMARHMLHDALEAFVHRDLELVEEVIAFDDQVDALYARMQRELQAIMRQDQASVSQASYLLFVAHYLERICDHCTNIAERVAFIETGSRRLPVRGGTVTTARNEAPPTPVSPSSKEGPTHLV